MIEQRRYALDACRAVISELDSRLSECSLTGENRDHAVWLVTGAAILADVAVEWRDSEPTPTPKPEPVPETKPDHEAMRRRVLDNIKRGILRDAAEKPVVEVCQFDYWVNGDAITTGTRYELLRSLSPDMPVRALVHPDCERSEVARILRKIADDIESMKSREAAP